MIQQIWTICTILQQLGQYTNITCGGHIHIGANYLTNLQAWKNLLELWTNTEYILYIISNKEGEPPRPGIAQHATPISSYIEEQFDKLYLYGINDLDILKNGIIDNICKKRGCGINFQNLKKGKMQTIEFRISNGTLSSETWLENIILFGGLVRASEELYIIQQKDKFKRTIHEKYLLDCFESIRNKSVDEEQTLELLLQIVAPEGMHNVYKERYRINRVKLKQAAKTEEYIKKHVSKKSIRILRKKALVFTGFNRVTTPEYNTTHLKTKGDFSERNIERD